MPEGHGEKSDKHGLFWENDAVDCASHGFHLPVYSQIQRHPCTDCRKPKAAGSILLFYFA